MFRTFVTAAVALLWKSTLAAQTGAVGGTVLRDSIGHTLGDVLVAIPALNRSTRSNFRGEFRLEGVAAGRYALVFRRVGFAPLTDSVTVRAGQSIDAEWTLTEVPTQLDSTITTATARPRNGNLIEFEERRKLGFGKFIDEAELRKVEGARPLINYIASTIPGIAVYRPDEKNRPLDYYLGSGRRTTGALHCPLMIYVDGAVYAGGDRDARNLPDLSKLSPDDFSAVEYYAGGGSVPAKYNATANGCGVLLLWRRYQ